MSDVRTFKAASMQEALTLVREEMGSEAVILQTRQIPGRKSLLPWSRTQETYEITAGLGIETKTPAALQNKNRSSRAGSALRHRASNLPQENRQRETVSQPLTAHQEAPAARRETAPRRESAYSHPSEQPRFRQRFAEAVPREVTPSQKHFDPTEEFTEKLNAIQEMLESLDRRTRSHRSSDVPSELFHIYTDLIDAEVDESIAHDLIARLKEHASHEQLKDSAASKSLLAALIESQLVCSQPIRPVPGQRKVVALVGPTGVGKTTTIAKLAANFRLRDNIKMGLVTVDTYRIAAVEQLRTYAEIIDLPMQVVSTPKEMQQALDEMVGLDLVLIDTAGRSPSDDLKIQELERLFREVPIDEVSLVMSMTSSVKTLEAIAQRFQVARPTSMILTKLDEAPVMGSLLTLSQNVKLPVDI